MAVCFIAFPLRTAGVPPARSRINLIRFRQAEHALGDVAQDQLRADGRDAGDLDLAEIALDMVLAGVAHAAMGHDRGLAGAVAGLGGAVFGGVGIGAGLLAAVIDGRRPQHHQLGRLELDPALGERVLDRLVLAYRAAEDDPLTGITRGAGECGAAETDGLGADQNPLRVHSVQDVMKALAFLANTVLHGHL